MVLLFWALFSSTAHASIVNFMRCNDVNDSNCTYSPPPIEAGPVIEKLRKHYCTGNGHPLILPSEEVYTPALVEEMATRAAYRADNAMWIGAQREWNDNTIFADMPYNYDLWVKLGAFAGIMNNDMARLLDVHCPSGKTPTEFYVAAVDK